jgi:hypothetical protein
MLETAVTPSIIPLSVYNDDSVIALVSFAFPSNSTSVAIQARADSFKEFVCFTCAFSIITSPDGCTSIWGQLSEYLCTIYYSTFITPSMSDYRAITYFEINFDF